MRRILFLLAVAMSLRGVVCEPDLMAAKAILQADQLGDQRLSRAERTAARLKILDAALRSRPEDIFLHSERQELALGRFGESRAEVLAFYEKRLAGRPASLERMYLVALVAFSYQTPRSLALLETILSQQPNHGPALLLRARIHSAKSFRAEELVKADLLHFERACPSTPGVFGELAWMDDKEFLGAYAARLRPIITARSNTLSLRAYAGLWQAEKNASRSDRRAAINATWGADLARIRKATVPRSGSWFEALSNAEFLMDKRVEGFEQAAYVAAPHAWPSLVVPITAARQLPAAAAKLRFRELGKAYPASTGLGSHWISFARSIADDGVLLEAFQFMDRAMELDPDSFLTLPPFQISMAQDLVEKRLSLELVPQFAIAGLNAAVRAVTRTVVSDLFPNDGEMRKRQDDGWRLDAYFAMLEAYAALHRQAEANDILAQAKVIADRMRPLPDASAEARGRYARIEANYWRVKGLVDESAGRKAEAVEDYRMALTAYPPRSVRGDDRDAVAASLRRLLGELGREKEALPVGWQDGNGGRNAWLVLAERRPGETIIAMDGKTYTPEQLSRQVSFVNIWATWCGPCREELPFLEQLAKRYAGKVVFVALNIDEETERVAPFLKSLHFGFGTTLGGAFAYEMLPVFGVPANYLLTPATTTYVDGQSEGAKWLEQTAKALDAVLR